MPDFQEHIERRSVGWGVFWWALSIAFHLAAVWALIHFTPLRHWFLRRSDPNETVASVTPARVRRIVEMMLASNRARMVEDIQKMRAIADEMTTLRGRAVDRYRAEATRSAAGVPVDDPLPLLGPAGPEVDLVLTGRDLPALYGVATNVELTVHGLYRHLRIVELARIQRIAIAEAMAVTQLVVPTHPPANRRAFEEGAALIRAANDEHMAALKAEVSALRAEMGSMVAACQRMLDMAHGLVGDDVGGTLGLPFAGAGTVAVGGEEGVRRLDDPFLGNTPPVADAYTHEWGVGVGPITQMLQLFPRQESADLGRRKPAAGRKLVGSAASAQAEWMYLDSWYVIGPFANPNRENIDMKFPPESSLEEGIDLDATYIGMLGPVEWQFKRSAEIPIIPHTPRDYAIYYAYTEVYSEKDEERWCIFGSDDYAKAWMNGDLIFASGKTPHPWIPDRAYKKVRFRRGFNPVLFKIENAWGRMGWSMCIYLGEGL